MKKKTLFSGLCIAVGLALASVVGCVNEEPCECIQSFGNPNMTSADIERLVDVGFKQCFDHNEPNALSDDSRCLPTVVGTDARNGKSLTVGYFCSDVCPDYGHINVSYTGVSEAECCSVGGIPAKDPGWGGYMGCFPPEIPVSTNGCP
ncbi:MAG: hypothetical protein IPM54_08710 [Polyangiaceae bacterium]|nr:hypothetical protein [Polyangiaceae bacterium]